MEAHGLTDAIDKACVDAVESDMGVEEDGRIVTNEMLHPKTDSGKSQENAAGR